MKYFFILLTALLLIAGGGVGGYFFFSQTAVASAGIMSEAAIAAREARKEAKLKAKEDAENVHFVEMDPIILPIVDTNGVSQVITLVVSLEVYGEENAALVGKMKPRLKDAYIQHMYGVLSRKASTTGGVVKVDDLKSRLNMVSGKVMGGDKINNVLLQVVSQRPI